VAESASVAMADQTETPVSSAVADALRERNALWAEAVRARALEHEVQAARTLLGRREASRSWSVTAPLRRAGERLHALWR
jgi:hypothetical protein